LYRTRDVLDVLLAELLEGEAQFVENLIADHPAHAEPARLRQGLQAARDVDPVAEDVVAVDDDVADVDPHAKLETQIGRDAGIAFGHSALHIDGAADRFDDAGEFE